jgi:membrane protein YdbS with pleckstrin-like domain
MFCNECGQTLPDGSRFCNICGAHIARSTAPADSPVAVADYADEHEVFTLRPTMIFVLVRYVVAGLIVIATAALMGVLSSMKPEWVSGQIAFLVILGVALIAFSTPIYNHILRKREVYTLTSHKLEMRFGIIAKIVRNIPLLKLQDVTVTASFWQRLFKLGDIEIDSASETGKIIWRNIHYPDRYANMILSELRRRN